ncbi:MAG: aspartate--ammonia ligase [Bacteroidetes bacterium GWF2_41_61]|nr:MAG: aspartate--ammonia ligase [Bacteroidetes bacterium GWF2_41_61]OFY91499.1 MAG: aspartate--ammonia ligase [Bacteroidetes bacterium RIFOXYA12_FULL_40_10]
MDQKILETEKAITFVKYRFTKHLAQQLNLIKVSSPLAVLDGTGINDDLNGTERPVSFPVKALGEQKAQVVHSLAKWKRLRLMQLGIEADRGILTDMRALRPDEDYTNLHSVYVDQWDWEQHIDARERTLARLKSTVKRVYEALRCVEMEVFERYPQILPVLPSEITFIHSQELLVRYPALSVKEREYIAAKEYGAIFLIGIGNKLSNGEPHDGRAPDYDDWSSPNEEGYFGLNGDIIVWHPTLECALELSSMGVRVDRDTLLSQLSVRECPERALLPFHKMLLDGRLPQSIGGGIGQSRVCMFMLKKRHIGEVQVGIWSDEMREELELAGVSLL